MSWFDPAECQCRDYGRDASQCKIHGRNEQLLEEHMKKKAAMDKFETGATRDASTRKIDYEAFLSPLVIHAYGKFMHYNRELEDGSLRAGDNWQLGIPRENYMKSGWRHLKDWWLWHRGLGHLAEQTLVWTLCAVIFNASGYLHEVLKEDEERLEADRMTEEDMRADRRSKQNGTR